MKQPAVQAVIMAGGSGTRFWPRSRRTLPKQFLRIGSTKTLLRETYERLVPVCGAGGVHVVTGREHRERVLDQIPEISPASILCEPVGRDTAACIGFAAEWLEARGGGEEQIMLVCPSDHVIRPPALFEEAARSAIAAASASDSLVTLGIPPRGPSSAFGYIHRGDRVGQEGSLPLYRVRRFVEKPDRARAEEYLREGSYFWNSGLFIWRTRAIRDAIRRHFPELSRGLEPMARELQAGAPVDRVLDGGFAQLAKNSIDRAVMEKAALAERVLMVEAPFEWDDVGSWNALERYLPRDEHGNHCEGKHVGVDTERCIISGTGKRLIATIGLQDLVIVETDDAILICHRDQTEKVKELVDRLSSHGEDSRA